MKRKILLYSFLFLILLVFGRATLEVAPFGAGLFLALTSLGFNVPVMSPMLVLSGFLYNFDVGSLISSGVCVAVNLVYFFAFSKKKKFYPIFGGLSLAGYIALAARRGLIETILTAFLIPVFAFVCYTFLRPVVEHKLKYKLLDTEAVCGAVMLIVLGLGLKSINIKGFTPLYGVGVLATIVAGKFMGAEWALAVGISLGIGGAIYDYSPTTLAIMCFISAVLIIFLPAPRILAAPAAASAYAMFTFFFETDIENALFGIISVLAGGIIYALLPKSLLTAGGNFFGAPKTRTALRYIVNKNRRDTGNELLKAGEIFGEMSETMLYTSVSEKHLQQLKDAVVSEVCAKCSYYNACLKNGATSAIDGLIKTAFEKGNANIIAASPKLSENCANIVNLINCVNELVKRFDELKRHNDNLNEAKSIVSSQLNGMSDILKSLAMRQSIPIIYDEDKERRIMDELTYRGVLTGEVWVKANDEVVIIALKKSVDENIVAKSLKKLFGREYVLKIEDSSLAGWSVITADPAPKYDVVFGSCNSCKVQRNCGDTHSFMKLDEGRFMAALCDGMGSGGRARRFSSATLSLVENFYRAGFEHSLVLSSVNKFLSLSGEETYGAMDIAVIDLNTLVTDIIKIGSPATYIKNSENLVKVEGSALPIGVLEEMKPCVRTFELKPGDTVVFTSDGVADCFEGDGLASVINCSSGLPKELASTVIDCAIRAKAVHEDDMTALAFRIFERN